jgi:hypothetical protein
MTLSTDQFTIMNSYVSEYKGTLSKETFSEETFSKATFSASSDDKGIEVILEKVLEKQLESQLNPLKEQMTSLNECTVEEIRQLRKELLSVNHELLEKNKSIEKLLIARKNTKRVYYVGLLTGLLSIFGGIFIDIIYAIVGIGIAITALVGLYEARENGW